MPTTPPRPGAGAPPVPGAPPLGQAADLGHRSLGPRHAPGPRPPGVPDPGPGSLSTPDMGAKGCVEDGGEVVGTCGGPLPLGMIGAGGACAAAASVPD